jgi:hypothetical protein
MPTAALLKILQYVDGDSDKRYHPDILAFERTCRSFHHLLKDDTIWGTLFPDEYRERHFDHPPTMREKTFLRASLSAIRKYQKSDANILLEYLGGAVGVRRIVGLLLDEMNPLRIRPPLFLRGDAIEYLVEVIQGYMIARLQKVNLLVIEGLSPGDGYPEVREKDLRLFDGMTLTDDNSAWARCSIAHNKHTCKRIFRVKVPINAAAAINAGSVSGVDWTWPDHNCASEEILGAEERRKMVRALAYRAGIVKMSGSVFSIVATEVLHHMAVIVSYAYETSRSDSPVADQSDDIHLGKGIQRGLNYYANFHPPGQTELVVIPRQIRDAAVMIGMKPLLGFGLFGAEWAASNDDERHDEVENAEDQYYPEEEIESEDERDGGGEGAIVPAPELENNPSLILNWTMNPFYRY